MTIDLSELTPKKRMMLTAQLELLEHLEKTIPQQAKRVKKRKKKLKKTLPKWKRDLENVNNKPKDVEPALRRIEKRFMETVKVTQGEDALVCPECGRPDMNNKKDGKPWCVFCHSPLVPKSKLKRWKSFPRVNVLPKQLKDELKRLGYDL